MKLQPLHHHWPTRVKEAIALQCQLRDRVVSRDLLGPVHRVAGIDVGFEDEGAVARAGVAVLSFPDLELVDFAVAKETTRFPYVPGLLSFREAPAALNALSKLSVAPDLILYDGQGYAHPRRFGIACHVGLLADIPSIGVAKTRLIGEHAHVPKEKGKWVALTDKDEIIGAVLRTRTSVAPLFVSMGHRVSLVTAVRWVMACVTRYRLPETSRWAHRMASGQGG
jgi:deoxyribonuclease V